MTTTASGSSFLSRNWFWLFVSISGVYVILPFLAPVFMALGWNGMGRVIYFIYSFLCHQLPQRSYFLFGQHFTYPLAQIQQVTGVSDPNNFFALRSFIGNPEMGWKVAWSDRMISMFTSIPLFALVWYPLRRWIKALPWWVFILMILPVALDGTTHFISDFNGIGQGFRDTNLWLATLTKGVFSPAFYAGDAWGSFNSITRLLTGILFGMGIVWFGFPYLEEQF
ncbi:MAG: hypothetical protein A2X25_11870 [Chloroflexi bacterium GWB2_49_20]|nr:MAG: hypothetical protein A2X25_11870 [Chloroflexi bacterium GWB2_49_20]OGN77701.1 MAG: hypothetical protein A2X26_10140 [Chloroflexi bacterium GWC2_49_37]OGN86476.1 MAG: hypothetical protein A2X27_06295 [Chloroflexi bacterium GWD2_49_16]HBG74723.1 hypothetical protein [Anaerolineae bacterium]